MKINQETLKELLFTNSLSEVIEIALTKVPEYPKQPKQPRLFNSTPTETEAENYVLLLKRHDASKIIFEEELKAYRLVKEYIYEEIATFIKEHAGLNTIPEQYREKVWNRAYADGHSSGYYEVYLKLDSLLDIFN